MDIRLCVCLLIYFFVTVFGETSTDRNKKLISVFQVVKFKNSWCTASNVNGTCYTANECETIGGTSTGTCADGFGVCCIVKLKTSGTSSQNNTYIYADNTIATGAYTYTICPCSTDICRVKFDFVAFQLSSPNSGFGFEVNAEEAALLATDVGKCVFDTFQISSPSGRSSPQICGNNANQHMFLDAVPGSSDCLDVNVGISGTASETRSLDILVTQYACGDENGGPAGCLQYFQNPNGKIRSFNFPETTPGATLAGGYTYHLHDQHYEICIRRELGKDLICYIPCTNVVGTGPATAGKTITAQPSFGLSASETSIEAKAIIDTECSTDYIWIRPGTGVVGEFDSSEEAQDLVGEASHPNRFCGRYFGTTVGDWAAAGDTSICSYGVPFTVGVEFDESDVCTVNSSLITCESIAEIGTANNIGGSGNLGFSLCYQQKTGPI